MLFTSYKTPSFKLSITLKQQTVLVRLCALCKNMLLLGQAFPTDRLIKTLAKVKLKSQFPWIIIQDILKLEQKKIFNTVNDKPF
jgi:hypothetical protein